MLAKIGCKMTPVSSKLLTMNNPPFSTPTPQTLASPQTLRSVAEKQLRGNAEQLLAARLQGIPLSEFPGILPGKLSDAYYSQDHAIALRNTNVVGWKVGFIAPELRDESGDERVLGPIFVDLYRAAKPGETIPWRFIDGGFAAVEAEFVIKLKSAVRPNTALQSEHDIAALVECVHVGIELAGSPLRTINAIGPMAVASDFGNNNGLILGPVLDLKPEQLSSPEAWAPCLAKTWINERLIGEGGAHNIPGTPWSALVFALRRLQARGVHLQAGALVATGASTGIHVVEIGDRALIEFTSSDHSAMQLRCCIESYRGTLS